MSVKFNVTLPDEPYKSTTSLNKQIEINYTGHRYVIFGYDNVTGEIVDIPEKVSKMEDIDLSKHQDPKLTYEVLDSVTSPFIAAYLTGHYINASATYSEDLPDGTTYEYTYEENGALQMIFENTIIKYNADLNTYTSPTFLKPGVSNREEITSTFADRLADATEVLQLEDLTDEERTQAEQYKTFYETFETVYEGVDHWKIRFPTLPR